jgi:2-polyprenyl-3-methyl-5-hydroxy-6-metoxy-1,4-benzoquinol methylase
MNNCRICDGSISESYVVKEMLIGLRDSFEYIKCSACGCLQIGEMPPNLSKYYPDNYYSFQASKKKKSRVIRDYIRKSVALYNIQRKGVIGWLLAFFKSPDPIHLVYRRVGLKPSDKLLDVGGGAGAHALSLFRIGFKSVMSVDPFISEDVFLGNVLIAKKLDFFDIQGKYDLITFHHSLEHMPAQLKTIEKAAELIGQEGRILIRIPTVTSTAWARYKENWVNLDAPRHFYIHSHASIKLLAEQTGLKVLDFWCDSISMQFWGSEQYIRDIPLTDPCSYSKDKAASIFSSNQILDYQRETNILNKEGKGDWICIVLGK